MNFHFWNADLCTPKIAKFFSAFRKPRQFDKFLYPLHFRPKYYKFFPLQQIGRNFRSFWHHQNFGQPRRDSTCILVYYSGIIFAITRICICLITMYAFELLHVKNEWICALIVLKERKFEINTSIVITQCIMFTSFGITVLLIDCSVFWFSWKSVANIAVDL